MSSATPGPDPDSPQGTSPEARTGWSGPPPQGYSPAPDHSSAPDYSAAPDGSVQGAAAARPPQVLTAAVLGLAEALLLLLAALFYFAFSSVLGLLALFGVLYLALAAGNIWGGITALQGKGSRILAISAGVSGALALAGLVLAAVGGAGFDTFSLLVLILGAGIVFLLYQPPSKNFFAARGTR